MISSVRHVRGTLALTVAVAWSSVACAGEGSAIAPKFLWTASQPFEGKVSCDRGVSVEREGAALRVRFADVEAQWPSFTFVPAKPWNLSPWGRVEAQIKNVSEKAFSASVRVDNPGDWRSSPWNTEGVYLKPGESKVVKVVFGYQNGFKKGYKLDSSKVSSIKIFLNGKSAEVRELLLTDLIATGVSGEKPAANPDHAAVAPKGGVIVPMKDGRPGNLAGHAGAKAAFAPNGTLSVDLGTKAGAALRVKPARGFWNLGQWLKVVATVRNTGKVDFHPIVKVDGNGGAITVKSPSVVKRGEVATVEIPFVAATPWVADGDARGVKGSGGTAYESHRTKGVVFSSVEPGAAFDVVSVRAEKIVANPPKTLGMRPPVPGEWVRTLAEEFNDGVLNEKVWSPYSLNYWDNRTHFSRENVVFRDGCAVLKYERKRGHENDDPARKATAGEGYDFIRWIGDTTGIDDSTAAEITVVADAPRKMTAFFVPKGGAGVIYVSTDGDDGNDGTSLDKAKASVGAAVAYLDQTYMEGTVFVAPGIYEQSKQTVLSNAIEIVGMTGKPKDVILRNNATAAWDNKECRVFHLRNAKALVTGLTIEKGSVYNVMGGNLLISADGGSVSNCVIASGYGSMNTKGANAALDAANGVITHCVISNGALSAHTGESSGTAVFFSGNGGRLSNCLITRNASASDERQKATAPSVSMSVVCLNNGVMDNCTIVDNCHTGLTAGVYAKSDGKNLRVVNCVIAGNTELDGSKVPAYYGNGAAKFANCVTDDEKPINATCKVGIADEMFVNPDDGKWQPLPDGSLADAGTTNNLAVPSVDLKGNPRIRGEAIDLGCYEVSSAGFFIRVR